VQVADSESLLMRILTRFRCFRPQTAAFQYSALAQDEQDDVEFTVDGKDTASSVSHKIRLGQFALDDDDDDDDDLLYATRK
jgi:hypothetical protein